MQFSKSVYIIITTHGHTRFDPLQSETELKTFEVPDDMHILSVMASPPGVINTTCSRSLYKFNNIIASNFETMDDSIKEHIDELDILVPEVDRIRKIIKTEENKLERDYYKHYQDKIDKETVDMQHVWDSRYSMSVYGPGNDMLNKRFSFNRVSNGLWLDNTIQLFNLPNIDEDFDIIQAMIDSNPDIDKNNFETNMSNIIDFLRGKGIKNITIFDFSCSVFMDEKNIEAREIRRLRRTYKKEHSHPYKKTSTFSGGVSKTRRSKTRRSKTRRSKTRRNKTPKRK